MSNFQQRYKQKTAGFRGADEGRLVRVEIREATRKQLRADTFNKNRNISEIANNSQHEAVTEQQGSTIRDDRATRLQKWRIEKERRKRMEAKKKKPPFKVGIVHHKVYSPISLSDSIPVVEKRTKHQATTVLEKESSKKISKATEKRLKAKTEIDRRTRRQGLRAEKIANTKVDSSKRSEKSFAPPDHEFKAPVGLRQVPLFGRVLLSPAVGKNHSFAMSPLQMRSMLRNSSTPKFNVENFGPKESEVPSHTSLSNTEVGSTKDDTSVEAITLKLSSDELNSSTEKDQLNESKKFVDAVTSLHSNASESMNTSVENKPQQKSDVTNISAKKVERTPSGSSNSPSDPAFFSPYVVSSRGKNNARKEQQQRRGLGRSPVDSIPTKETVMQNLNISIEDEERTAQYFHFLLDKEIKRLEEVCNKWEVMKWDPDVTEDAQYRINQAIGQTNLLLTKKFDRFRGLVNDCETGKGEMLVTCKDLQGFWDMMYREVKDCDARFEKLEVQRAQNWKEETPIEIKPLVKKRAATKKKKVAATSGKPSSLRAFIMAARKGKKVPNVENNSTDADDSASVSSEASNNITVIDRESNKTVKPSTRRSRSLNVQQSKSTPAKKESRRTSLLQKVQLSEASRKLNSPLALMKISKMCKTPDIRLDSSISYINSDQTPGKSILKKSKDPKENESVAKSAHKVNFNDTVVLNETPMDEETQTKLDLAAALARIDSLNFDAPGNEGPINAERKLTFDSDSSDDSIYGSVENEEKMQEPHKCVVRLPKLDVPDITVQTATPTHRRRSSSSSSQETRSPRILMSSNRSNLSSDSSQMNKETAKNTKLRRQNAVNEDSDTDEEEVVRSLRNRSISFKLTPKTASRKSESEHVSMNAVDIEHKENRTPSKAKRKSSSKAAMKNDDELRKNLEDAMSEISITANRRKSSRRSVKFSGGNEMENCTGCVEVKPPLPMTPHVRRSRVTEKTRRNTIAGNPNVQVTPEKPPERVRRSRSRKV